MFVFVNINLLVMNEGSMLEEETPNGDRGLGIGDQSEFIRSLIPDRRSPIPSPQSLTPVSVRAGSRRGFPDRPKGS
jgi:hypothetical protein